MDIPSNSFTFNGKNSLLEWGIKVIAHDEFCAIKRDRRKQIPFKHGSYDFGEKFYGEKTIRLDCCTENKKMTKNDMREVIYALSKKGELFLWDEPDKCYVGELMSNTNITVMPKYVKQQFVLDMICEPFAMGKRKTIELTDANFEYAGTAPTSPLIIIKNNNSVGVKDVKLIFVKRI